MRYKRVLSIVGATALLTGLAMAPAEALPLHGTHEIMATCDSGSYHAKIKYKYSIVTRAVTDGTHYMDFRLLEAIYTGPGQYRSPGILVEQTGNNNPLFLGAAGGGGAGTATKPFTTGGTSQPPLGTNRINGQNGVNWPVVGISMHPARHHNNRLMTDWYYYPSCVQYWDLSLPNRVMDEVDGEAAWVCGDGGAFPGSQPPAQMNLRYTLYRLDDTSYVVEVDMFTLQQSTSVSEPYYEDVQLDLVSGDQQISLTPPGGMTEFPRDGMYSYPDEGFEFPAVTGTYITGASGAPQIRMLANSTNGTDCVRAWHLTEVWGVPGQTFDNTTTSQFDDCSSSPQPHGQVSIKTYWEWDANSEKVKLRRATVTNGSSARLVMLSSRPNFPAQTLPMVRSDDGDGTIFMSSNMAANATDRILTAGQVKDLNIGDPALWHAHVFDLPSAAPLYSPLLRENIPVLEFSFEAQKANGTGWVTCPTGAQLAGLEGTSARVPAP